jgi:hypothetical protein
MADMRAIDDELDAKTRLNQSVGGSSVTSPRLREEG